MSRRPGSVLGILAVGAAAVPLALASPAYREQAIRQFHYEGSVLSRRTMACTFCHVNDRGGAPWNAFGEALKTGFRDKPTAKFDAVLYEVLAAGGDADEDGYGDALEVFARTLPGDAASVPKESLAALRARFEKAGGIEQYRAVAPSRKR